MLTGNCYISSCAGRKNRLSYQHTLSFYFNTMLINENQV